VGFFSSPAVRRNSIKNPPFPAPSCLIRRTDDAPSPRIIGVLSLETSPRTSLSMNAVRGVLSFPFYPLEISTLLIVIGEVCSLVACPAFARPPRFPPPEWVRRRSSGAPPLSSFRGSIVFILFLELFFVEPRAMLVLRDVFSMRTFSLFFS